MQEQPKAKIFFFVPVARFLALNFVSSFERARAEADHLGIAAFTVAEWNGFSVDIANKRNVGVSRFLQSDMEWLMMVDDDMDFRHDPAAIAKMLAVAIDQKADIVAPLMVRRDPPHYVCYNETRGVPDDTLKGYMAHKNDQVIECTGHVGTGCILIRRKVVEALEPPWFQTVPRFDCRVCQSKQGDPAKSDCERCHGKGKDPEGCWFEQGEDTFFCRNAHDAGFKVVCAAGIKVGHLGESSLTIEDSVRVTYPVIHAQGILHSIQRQMADMEERNVKIPDGMRKALEGLSPLSKIQGNGEKKLVVATR